MLAALFWRTPLCFVVFAVNPGGPQGGAQAGQSLSGGEWTWREAEPSTSETN